MALDPLHPWLAPAAKPKVARREPRPPKAEPAVGKRAEHKMNSEFGMRPPASPSCRLYEPEAIGACAPEGSRKEKETWN